MHWRDLPERFGPWKTVYERHRLWSADGTWERLLQQVQAEPDAVGEIDWDVSVDSAIVRAHQHAAGARTDPPPALAVPKGASRWNTRAKLRGEASSTGWWRWCRRRGPGAFARRLHQQDPPDRGRPLPPVVPDRHTGAAGRLHPVRAGAGEDPGPRPGSGRPRKKPDSVAADKGYSNGPCREYLRRRGIRHIIPEKADSRAARLRKGSRGGRPPGFDEERYKKRNTVERAVNRLKNFRAVATRYDKRGYVFLGTVSAAAVIVWLRS